MTLWKVGGDCAVFRLAAYWNSRAGPVERKDALAHQNSAKMSDDSVTRKKRRVSNDYQTPESINVEISDPSTIEEDGKPLYTTYKITTEVCHIHQLFVFQIVDSLASSRHGEVQKRRIDSGLAMQLDELATNATICCIFPSKAMRIADLEMFYC
jgi:hypothetical protein